MGHGVVHVLGSMKDGKVESDPLECVRLRHKGWWGYDGNEYPAKSSLRWRNVAPQQQRLFAYSLQLFGHSER